MPVTTRKQASNSDTSEFEDAVLTSEQTDEGTQLFVTEGPLTFEEHCDRWEIYFEGANITVVQKRKIQFLNFQDDKMYGTISTLCLPKKQVEPSSLVHQDKFNNRVQKRGESAAEFLADLQRIASKCKFHNVDEQVRSRLISGMRNEKLKESLLAEREEKLTLEYVIQRLMAQERAVAATKALSVSDSDAAAVNKVYNSPKKQLMRSRPKPQRASEEKNAENATFQCFCCGKQGHKFYQCTVRSKAFCSFCKMKGSHFTGMCKKKTEANFVNADAAEEDEEAEEDDAEEQENVVINHLLKIQYSQLCRQKPLQLEIPINGKKLTMEVDSGATFSLIGFQTWLDYKKPSSELLPTKVKMRPWGQNRAINAAGVVKVQISLKQQTEPKLLDLLVMQQNGPSLIGRNWFEALGITLSLPTIETKLKEKRLKQGDVPNLFKITEIPQEVREIQRKTYSYLSLSLNPQAERADFPLPKADDLRTQVKPGYHMSRFDLKDAYLQFELDEESSMMIVINTHRGRYRFKRLPPELEFLGFQFTKAGIRPTDEKVKALQQMRYPENREELQAYLGLLRKGVKFEFTEECKRAVDEAKLVMSKKPCLAFYDESLPVVVACDGSRKGIGAVLSHETKDGEIPVEIEALAVVWAVKKFRQFLWGRKFTLITDHKPLIGIFGEGKGVNEDLPTKLKRLPLPDEDGEEEELEVADCKIAFLECFQHDDIMSLAQLKQETEKDPKMSQLKTLILQVLHQMVSLKELFKLQSSF
ncbi:Hypothetical predicted protein [Cloeon dipterum]|uniref:CCHC-type domain-containing protein n=1 Tax=Cloeon dipterum TaxID=197152 RepID=A0A8S1E7W6_9INSE|nr:Hypothetical predicted protein [Cloeon dipterum]